MSSDINADDVMMLLSPNYVLRTCVIQTTYECLLGCCVCMCPRRGADADARAVQMTASSAGANGPGKNQLQLPVLQENADVNSAFG